MLAGDGAQGGRACSEACDPEGADLRGSEAVLLEGQNRSQLGTAVREGDT